MSKAYLGKEGGWGGSRLGATGSASWRLGGLGDPASAAETARWRSDSDS